MNLGDRTSDPVEAHWYLPVEIAALLKTTTQAVNDLISRGELDASPVAGNEWRVSASALNHYLRLSSVTSRRQRRTRNWRLSALAVVVVVTAALVYSGNLRAAATTGPGSHRIPYQGLLEQTGLAVDGPRQIEFCLYRDATPAAPCVWKESHSVQVSAGRFSVMLGETTALDPVIAAGGPLYVGVTLSDADGSHATPLSGRQQVGAVPYAWRGAPGVDFVVDGAVSAKKLLGDGSVPAGALMPYAGLTPPPGWHLANGALLNVAQFPALAAVLGTAFGGDGTSTFALPDLRGRTVVAMDNLGGVNASRMTSEWASMLGGVGGAEAHVLTIDEMPKHSHRLYRRNNAFTDGCCNADIGTSDNGGPRKGTDLTGNTTDDTGASQAHNITQPSMSLSYIIKD